VVNVDRHFEHTVLIEDIVATQAQDSLRQFHTQDAGYQLAKQIDTDLIYCATGFGGDAARVLADDGSADPTDWEHSAGFAFQGATAGLKALDWSAMTSDDFFSDSGFREAIRRLDDNDVPMDSRVLVIPPSVKEVITGIERYVSTDFTDQQAVKSGKIGNLYGVDVYVSTNLPTFSATGGNARPCLFMHKDAVVLAEQMAVRSQTQYKQEFLATMYTADCLYGVQVYRPENGLVIGAFEAS
jgi:hypothetical protein